MSPSGRSANPTLRDVAERSGVSIATVSKALNGKRHVRDETRERVRQAALDLGFVPNMLARNLLTGRTGTVGLLTNDLEGRFSIPVLMGAEDAFGSGSMSVLLCDARGDAIREQHHLRALLSRRIDGLIVVGDSTNPRQSLGQRLQVPVVYAYAPSADGRDISVVSDNVNAGRLAAEHLLDCGRTRIAYVSGDVTFAAATDRVSGAETALAGADLQLLGGHALYGSWSEVWGRGGAQTVLNRFPDVDGILCGSDQIARGVLDSLRDAGRRVPQDVAVMGHDNSGYLAGQSRPPLSSVDMGLQEVGRRAAQLLFEAIDGAAQPGIHPIACHLVVRESSARTG